VRLALSVACAAAFVAAGVALAARPVVRLAGTDPVTGKHMSLAQFRGRPVVINIWASWCDGCNHEARELQRFATAHPGLQLLGIDYQDSKAGARAFSRRYGQEWPSIFDPTGRISRRLPLLGLPTPFFLDRRHRIVRVLAGAGTYAEFRAAYRLAYR
jgi:thiol-disulfide isomerase/thioredoxin